MPSIADLRRQYHQDVCEKIIRLRTHKGIVSPNFADSSSRSSRAIAMKIMEEMGTTVAETRLSGQESGALFEQVTREFLERAFALLHHLRPGAWHYFTGHSIADFDQYAHLATIDRIVSASTELKTSLGTDYIVRPDILIARAPVSDDEINAHQPVVSREEPYGVLAPLREGNVTPSRLLLHASISCKWTVRSDRAQNTRTEALNLIRNRKGHLPHVMIVTAEPMPTRISSLAMGTGDVDCVYHFALNELRAALETLHNEDQLDMLATLVEGRRLRDISDLPLDLAL